MLDEARAELAQARIELDHERAVSCRLLPRSYEIAGKSRPQLHRDAILASGAEVPAELSPREIRERFEGLIARREAAQEAN